MPEFKWPEESDRWRIGREITRVDGPAKVSGRAEYTYDVNLFGMLHGMVVTCPHAHARILSIDTSAAKQIEGVKAVRIIQDVGSEIQWALDEVVSVAAETEEICRDAVRAVKIEYEVLDHFLDAENGEEAPGANPAQEQTTGDPETALAQAKTTCEGTYGLELISHCCLESHGHVAHWEDDEHLTVFSSTQGVSSLPGQFSEALGIPAANVRVICQHVGGGFGSKFSADRWGIECAQLARETKRPVKLMLDRGPDLQIAGGRPSVYAKVKVGADAEGNIVGWSSKSWGTGGPSGSGSPPLPYVVQPANQKQQHVSVPTNTGPARAWRAPNHPQACFVTMAALEDLAAAMNMDPLDLFLKNTGLTGPRAEDYRAELVIGAKLMGWKERWHPRGESKGPVRQGLGLSLHTWGGRGHQSNCDLLIYPDGSVETRLGSQDLGTGTRTVISAVVADTFGLRVRDVSVRIGDSRYPASGASGGSTTVGGVSAASRRAAQLALEQLFAKVAPELDVGPDQLEVSNGRIRVKDNPGKYLTWKKATSLLGVSTITVRGANPGPGNLIDSGVGGIQMADVSVDVETGVVRINKIVAVQDCGLIIDMLTSKSQVYGGIIMGIGYALFEERVMDPLTGGLLNADMEFYKLPGIGDVGEVVIHMMTGPGYDERGVIGLGEPPVISPGAAISNAVANAIGVRVPKLPITPDRVLDALEKGGAA